MKSLQPIACSIQEIIKEACVIGGVLLLSLPALNDCVFVRLTVAPFVAGIKSLQGATRSGYLGWGGRQNIAEQCSLVLMCLNTGLLFPCPPNAH